MTVSSQVTLERIAFATGNGDSLPELAKRAVSPFRGAKDEIGAVVVATFSNPERFPPLSVRMASELELPPETIAFDLQMACSAYPYALFLAAGIAERTGRKVLVLDGDVQSPLVDASDHATNSIFSDAVSATLLSADPRSHSPWSFLSSLDGALACSAQGPIRMDGFKVFSFVATKVNRFLRDFLAECGESPECFAPHQANPYMIRQLARSLNLEAQLLTIDDRLLNPGSTSVAIALAANAERVAGKRVLLSGFGAGFSASAGIVRMSDGFKC